MSAAAFCFIAGKWTRDCGCRMLSHCVRRGGIDEHDVLEIMEQRHDWAKMVFTLELFKYVFFTLIPDVIRHSENQDTDQVRDHYDREYRSTGG